MSAMAAENFRSAHCSNEFMIRQMHMKKHISLFRKLEQVSYLTKMIQPGLIRSLVRWSEMDSHFIRYILTMQMRSCVVKKHYTITLMHNFSMYETLICPAKLNIVHVIKSLSSRQTEAAGLDGAIWIFRNFLRAIRKLLLCRWTV